LAVNFIQYLRIASAFIFVEDQFRVHASSPTLAFSRFHVHLNAAHAFISVLHLLFIHLETYEYFNGVPDAFHKINAILLSELSHFLLQLLGSDVIHGLVIPYFDVDE
jgi:hypothetical protein